MRRGSSGAVAAQSTEYRPDMVEAIPYVRPSSWIALPTITDGEAKIVGLMAVYPEDGSTHIAFTIQGACTVDWGDGTSNNYATNVPAEHSYTYSTLSAGTTTSGGYRQAAFTVTPQSGQSIVSIDFMVRSSAANQNTSQFTNLLDLEISAPECTYFAMGNPSASVARHSSLERFVWRGVANLTTAKSMFKYCYSLQYVIPPPLRGTTNSATTTSEMFYDCNSLRSITVPLDTWAVTDTSYMFNNCFLLTEAPAMATSSVTGAWDMFDWCFSLKYVPDYDFSAVQDSGYMFYYCRSLEHAPNLKFTSANQYMNYMFIGCSALKTVPLYETSGVLDMQSMFRYCISLKSVPDFNTASVTNMQYVFDSSGIVNAPNFNTANVTIMYSMFGTCDSLLYVPNYSTGSVTDMGSIFYSAGVLKELPAFTSTANVMNVSDAFYNCDRITRIPAYNLSAVTAATTLSSSTNNLRKSSVTGIKVPHMYTFGCLTATELNNIYTNLITLPTAKTITGASWASGGTVTYTTSVAHGFSSGQSVSHTGITPTGYNLSSQIITVTGTTTYTVASGLASTPGTYASGGTATQATAITVTSNIGNATDNPSIATAKGWTVVG
jgi:surface protein